MHPMIRRREAVEATVQRFVGKAYAPGVHDCARLAAFALRQMGHKVPLLKGAQYRTEAGGLKALRRLGFSDLAEAVDALGLVRIAPASALPGDIVALEMEGATGFGCALTVACGNGRVLGFMGGVCAPLEPAAFVAAWRV